MYPRTGFGKARESRGTFRIFFGRLIKGCVETGKGEGGPFNLVVHVSRNFGTAQNRVWGKWGTW